MSGVTSAPTVSNVSRPPLAPFLKDPHAATLDDTPLAVTNLAVLSRPGPTVDRCLSLVHLHVLGAPD